MVRMQADARLPPAERLGYKHVGDALLRIGREEGLATYWRGATPTGEVFFYADSGLPSPCRVSLTRAPLSLVWILEVIRCPRTGLFDVAISHGVIAFACCLLQ